MRTVEFDMWLDKDGKWTTKPVKKKKISLVTTKYICAVCEGEGKIVGKTKEAVCNKCNGEKWVWIPDYTKNDPGEVEAYFRQAEIETYKSSVEGI